jgi:hypothetical protein
MILCVHVKSSFWLSADTNVMNLSAISTLLNFVWWHLYQAAPAKEWMWYIVLHSFARAA